MSCISQLWANLAPQVNELLKNNIDVAQGAEYTPVVMLPFNVNSICQVHESLSLKYFRRKGKPWHFISNFGKNWGSV